MSNATHTETVNGILAAKAEAGENAFLWLHASSGDCILWADEASSEGDNGAKALARWTVGADEVEALIDAGEVDEIA